jgi:type III secretion system FlhB-like substrate exporter
MALSYRALDAYAKARDKARSASDDELSQAIAYARSNIATYQGDIDHHRILRSAGEHFLKPFAAALPVLQREQDRRRQAAAVALPQVGKSAPPVVAPSSVKLPSQDTASAKAMKAQLDNQKQMVAALTEVTGAADKAAPSIRGLSGDVAKAGAVWQSARGPFGDFKREWAAVIDAVVNGTKRLQSLAVPAPPAPVHLQIENRHFLDGHKLAQVVTQHQVKAANQTRSTGATFDPNRSLQPVALGYHP